MAIITSEYSSFFSELAENNHKEWFHANKKRYEEHVKAPFLGLLEEILKELMDLSPEISPNPKDALFRINKDIRFSKDKTPYNTLMKAGFAPGGKKSLLPGYYLGISATSIHVGGGLYNLKSPELKKIRSYIGQNIDEFIEVSTEKNLVRQLGGIKGEKAKRLDKEHQAIQSKTPLIANKQFFAMAEMPLEDFLNQENLSDRLMKYFRTIHPLNNFLTDAMKDD